MRTFQCKGSFLIFIKNFDIIYIENKKREERDCDMISYILVEKVDELDWELMVFSDDATDDDIKEALSDETMYTGAFDSITELEAIEFMNRRFS